MSSSYIRSTTRIPSSDKQHSSTRAVTSQRRSRLSRQQGCRCFQHGTILEEATVGLRQFEQIGRDRARLIVSRRCEQDFLEPENLQRQGPLMFRLEQHRGRCLSVQARIGPGLAEDASVAGISILHVGRCIAVHCEHLWPTKHIVGHAILRQIGILDCPDADCFGDRLHFRFGGLGGVLAQFVAAVPRKLPGLCGPPHREDCPVR